MLQLVFIHFFYEKCCYIITFDRGGDDAPSWPHPAGHRGCDGHVLLPGAEPNRGAAAVHRHNWPSCHASLLGPWVSAL